MNGLKQSLEGTTLPRIHILAIWIEWHNLVTLAKGTFGGNVN